MIKQYPSFSEYIAEHGYGTITRFYIEKILPKTFLDASGSICTVQSNNWTDSIHHVKQSLNESLGEERWAYIAFNKSYFFLTDTDAIAFYLKYGDRL
jgi:hypothetical protein